MDITDFFQQSAGKWVCQRTNHYLQQNLTEGAKADLLVEALPQDDPAVVQICQQQGIDPSLALCGLKMEWKATIDRNPKQQVGSSVVVAVADTQPKQGKILSRVGSNVATGSYSIGDDEVLTLTTEKADLHIEERIWFAGPNFRLRSSVMQRTGSPDVATFCSEIRLGGVQPPEKSTATEAAS